MSTAFKIQDHSDRLQSARGLAALCVTVCHCFTTMVDGRIEEATYHLSASNFLLSAGELIFQPNAVVFFYVLSGLVLSESLRRRPELISFVIRRIFRLVPVMWLSIAFALAITATLPPPPFQGATGWFNAFFGRPISISEVATDVVGLSWNINSVLWSVQIELAMMLPLPILLHISTRLPVAGNVTGFTLLAVLSPFIWNMVPGWMNAALYLYCFYAGIILPQLLQSSRTARVLASGVLTSGGLLILIAVEFLYVTHRLWMPYKLIVDAVISVQIIGFIITRADSRAAHLLTARQLVWLGDVSYSFYVFCMSLQLLIASNMLRFLESRPGGMLATGLTVAITLGTVFSGLVMAAICRRWVELPCIALGQKWSQPGAWPLRKGRAAIVRHAAQ